MHKSGRVLFIAVFLLFVFPLGFLLLVLQRRWQRGTHVPNAQPTPIMEMAGSPQPPNSRLTTTSPSPFSAEFLPAPPEPTDNLQPATQSASSYVGKLDLVIPVMGVTQAQLRDTFGDARSEGRVHDAIDIPASLGTPVIAAADGEIIKLFESERGGTTIYQLSTDRGIVYYYAHLQRYADQLAPGQVVRQGETIGYVGDTGNAGAGNYHLHFSIAVVADPKRYWEGENINPYPLLRK